MKTLNITRLQELDYTSKEAMNTLCTNLSFAGENVRKIMITSCRPHEGKSYMSINLMRTMGSIGKSVVLVDADLRMSILVGHYGIQSDEKVWGLSHYLAGMCKIDEIIYRTNLDNSHMVLSGQDVVNSLPLLNTPRLSNLLDELADMFDIVLVDTPPVGVIIDSAQIAKSCDGVMFVVTNNEINRRELKEARMQIEKTGCPILGAVLNKVDFSSRSARGYYHKSYYNSQQTYYRESSEPTRLRNKKEKPKKRDKDLDKNDTPTNQGIAE